MNEFRIRTATPDDAAAIAPLLGQLGYPTSPGQARQRLQTLLAAADRYATFVAENDKGALLGCASLERRITLDGDERAELMALVVDAATRRGGVGLALLQAGEAWARERGFGTLWVRSNVRRTESHPFYARHGFVLEKTQHTYAKRL